MFKITCTRWVASLYFFSRLALVSFKLLSHDVSGVGFAFIKLWVNWDFWICKSIFSLNFGLFFHYFFNINLILFFLSFSGSHYMYPGMLDGVLWVSEALFFVCLFFILFFFLFFWLDNKLGYLSSYLFIPSTFSDLLLHSFSEFFYIYLQFQNFYLVLFYNFHLIFLLISSVWWDIILICSSSSLCMVSSFFEHYFKKPI